MQRCRPFRQRGTLSTLGDFPMAFQRKKVAAALAYAVSVGTTATLLTAVPVYAQDMRVNVTGSNIKRVDNETASPIQVITREDIERTGASSVNELLQFIPSAGFGLDDRFTNGFAPGAGGLNIRNLGFNSTLILLNGKRMPTYPFAQQVGSSQGFQDLNSIPIGSVDRIEILKDGASAIYGADAVAGVVNVILRNNYVGAEAGASYGIAQEGDGDAWTVNGIFGMGDLAKDRYNVMLSGYYFKRKEIFARDRDFASNEDLRGRGGADWRSAYGFPSSYINNDTGEVAFGPTCDPAQVRTYCRYNRAAFGSLLPESERMNVSLKGSFMVTKEIELFADLMYSENKSYATGFPAPSTDDPLIGSDQLPIGHPNNPFPGSTATVLHRYQGVGTRDDDTTSKLSPRRVRREGHDQVLGLGSLRVAQRDRRREPPAEPGARRRRTSHDQRRLVQLRPAVRQPGAQRQPALQRLPHRQFEDVGLRREGIRRGVEPAGRPGARGDRRPVHQAGSRGHPGSPDRRGQRARHLGHGRLRRSEGHRGLRRDHRPDRQGRRGSRARCATTAIRARGTSRTRRRRSASAGSRRRACCCAPRTPRRSGLRRSSRRRRRRRPRSRSASRTRSSASTATSRTA
ncbi:MAG: TonB-dependent receptor plug domain-containing protein [Betaproteobacteria bacterium]|nr:TonB-dependent receptor plug domain-containing protein [Betaproteobacteria bacterium]